MFANNENKQINMIKEVLFIVHYSSKGSWLKLCNNLISHIYLVCFLEALGVVWLLLELCSLFTTFNITKTIVASNANIALCHPIM